MIKTIDVIARLTTAFSSQLSQHGSSLVKDILNFLKPKDNRYFLKPF